MFEVCVGSERRLVIGREAPGFRKRFVEALDVAQRLHLLADDFFLVEGTQDEHRRASVLERTRRIDVVAEWAWADDERAGQPESEIGGAEIHHLFPASEGAGSLP